MIQAFSPSPMSSNPGNACEMPPAHANSPLNQAAILQTILKLNDPGFLAPPAAGPLPGPDALAAMQRLVEMINQLRATAPSAPEFTTTSNPTSLLDTPAAIAPYVSEEAYEVLDVLQQEQSESIEGADQGQQGSQEGDVVLPLVTVEDLVPHLLWCIARTSYRVMQLLEGVSVRQCQPGQSWIAGMVRLVALLEITPAQPLAADGEPVDEPALPTWCFDLATGDLPTTLLDSQAWLQADENVLPVRPAIAVSDHPPASETGVVGDHLQELQRQMQATTLAIKPLFEGIPLELLPPGRGWQRGEVRLKLGFEFVPQPAPTPAQLASQQPDLVEAEWVEEGTIAVPVSSPTTAVVPGGKPLAQVCIVERPRLLNPATLIRLAGEGALERFAQANLQPYLAGSITRLKQDWNRSHPDNQLLAIVEQACLLSDQYPVLVESGLSPRLPELLMDELIPKLLWQITCSSYEGMQLLGGIPGRVLQPHQDWYQGTIRLLASLQIATDEMDWMFDLATGREVSSDTILLNERAVCQQSALPVPAQFLDPILDSTAGWRQPVQVTTLLTKLQQQIHVHTPALKLLLEGTPIEWLESEQDWQTAMLRLHLALAFTPVC